MLFDHYIDGVVTFVLSRNFCVGTEKMEIETSDFASRAELFGSAHTAGPSFYFPIKNAFTGSTITLKNSLLSSGTSSSVRE